MGSTKTTVVLQFLAVFLLNGVISSHAKTHHQTFVVSSYISYFDLFQYCYCPFLVGVWLWFEVEPYHMQIILFKLIYWKYY